MTMKQKFGRWLQGRLPISQRTFQTLRFELRSARQRAWNALLPWRRRKIARLRTLRGVSLNVGSGGRGRADWINLDASPHHADLYCTHDLRRTLPFAENAVRRILAEHVIEHLDPAGEVEQESRPVGQHLGPATRQQVRGAVAEGQRHGEGQDGKEGEHPSKPPPRQSLAGTEKPKRSSRSTGLARPRESRSSNTS